LASTVTLATTALLSITEIVLLPLLATYTTFVSLLTANAIGLFSTLISKRELDCLSWVSVTPDSTSIESGFATILLAARPNVDLYGRHG
jgi:hypothetical protein